MRKLLLLLLICPAFLCCQNNSWEEKLSDDGIFEFSASFDKSKTLDIQKRLTEKIGDGHMSFVDTDLDGDLGLSNGMGFYIKQRPGKLRIVFDRKKNTPENYTRMKEASEAISAMVNN